MKRKLSRLQLVAMAARSDMMVIDCVCIVLMTDEVVDRRVLVSNTEAIALSHYGDALVLDGVIDTMNISQYGIFVEFDKESRNEPNNDSKQIANGQ